MRWLVEPGGFSSSLTCSSIQIRPRWGPICIDDLVRMEALLSHRDRIADLSTWPLDVKLASRIALYVVLPPIAWSAAALVEVLIERFIAA